MAKKIDRLTAEQEAKMPEYIEKWTKIGQSCSPCDFETAKKHATDAYIKTGLATPKHMIQAKSPWSAAVITAIFQRMEQSQIDKYCQTPTQAVDELFPTFDPNELTAVIDGKRQIVCDKSELRAAITSQVNGSHDAGFLAFYDYCDEVLGLTEAVSALKPWIELSKVCGWWAPYDYVCVLQDRHLELHLDDMFRLSNSSDMAVRYGDGFGIWAIDGMGVDEQIVKHPQTQTLAQLENERNADLKEIRIRQFGWPNYIRITGAKLLNNGTNDIEGTEEALYRLADGSKRLLGSCKTGRVFAMSVHEDVETCEQARRWLSPVGGVNVVNRS